jgi:hypothetical protein
MFTSRTVKIANCEYIATSGVPILGTICVYCHKGNKTHKATCPAEACYAMSDGNNLFVSEFAIESERAM